MTEITTASGHHVWVQQVHIRTSSLGFLAGTPSGIRKMVLDRLPEEIRDTFGQAGLLVREPAPGALPKYTFLLQLQSSPLKPENDFSCLVVVWFADALPNDLPKEIMAQSRGIVWEEHAQDGIY